MMRQLIWAVWLVASAFLCVPAGGVEPPAPESVLPRAEWLATGELENGLTYLIKRHAQPPGRVIVWLHVDSGSLNEKDSQRGLAHFLEHMAFNGSENFAPGSVVPLFESLGMVFGRHQNAFTNFDQTTYQLTLPDGKPETLDKGMLFLSDVAFRLTLPDQEIDNERRVILEERRRSMNAERRVSDQVMKNIAPGSIVGERLTIGVEEVIERAPRAEFLDYYKARYVPSNMTMIVVGDTEPGPVIDAIKARFSGGQRVPKPADQEGGVRPTTGVRAIVAQEQEMSRASVSLAKVAPAAEPTTTVGQWRRELVERLGTTAFNRRMSELVSLGRAGLIEASARSGDVNRAMRRTEVAGTCEPDAWKKTLVEICTEVTRARQHGFTAQEIADARTQMEAASRRAAETEVNKPSSVLAANINQSVTAREPMMSAQQELDLGLALLGSVSDEEVSRVFAEVFDFSDCVFITSVPAAIGEITEKEVTDAGTAALGGTPIAHTDRPRTSALLNKLPSPGTAGVPETHVGASVQSMWLGNGVRAHYRYMPYKHNVVTVAITLAGGELKETAETRGTARGAAAAWGQPATSTLSSADVTKFMTGRNLSVIGRADSDALTMTVSGAPEQIEVGLQLAYLLLTDPKLEQPAFEKWKQRQVMLADRMDKDPGGRFARLLSNTIYPPGETRLRPLTREQLEKLDPAKAEAWLKSEIVTAPMEVSIVGDISIERATELLTTYIASLPKRERISKQTLAELRRIPAPAGDRSGSEEVRAETPQAQVMEGFFGPDATDIRDSRLMSLAARVLSTRMAAELREKRQLVYSIRAISAPGVIYPGYGLFSSAAPTDPAKAEELPRAIAEMYAAFAKSGPTPEEMETVKSQVTMDMNADLLEPRYWTNTLRDLDYHGVILDDVVGAPTDLVARTADEIRSAFAKYYEKGPKVRVMVRVNGEASAPAQAPAR